MSFAKHCCVCAKPLPDVRGPEVMDCDGDVYHFTCWCKVMDTRRYDAARLASRQRLDALRATIEETKALTRDIHKQVPPPD
jgi:hypothetical protein